MKTDRKPKLFGAVCVALTCVCFVAACSSGGGGRSSGSLAEKGPTVGQSGSEGVPSSGGSAVGCPCGQKDALRVTVLAKRGATVSLRVEQILHGTAPIAPGEVFEGVRYDDTLACYLGCNDVEVGEQALAFYAGPLAPPEPPCAEREACLAACDVENPDEPGVTGYVECACRQVPVDNTPGSATCGTPFGNVDCQGQCEYELRGRCPLRPEGNPKRAHVSLSPWRDPVVFARGERGELSVPIAQLEELFQLSAADQVACMERFGQWSDYTDSAGL